MGVHVVRPDGPGPFPVVVFYHHGPGLDEGSKETMALLASWGNYVVTHDRYYRSEPWFVGNMQSGDPGVIQKMFGLIMGTPEVQVLADLAVLLEWVGTDAAARGGAMACIGYCIGARSVLCTIREHGEQFRAGACLHPSLCTSDAPDSPHLAVPSYTGSLYVAYGALDTMQPASANEVFIASTNALAKGKAEVIEGADHGFAVHGPGLHEAAATRAYEQIKVMFDRELA
jgi:carboxymethylenebutenolidase